MGCSREDREGGQTARMDPRHRQDNDPAQAPVAPAQIAPGSSQALFPRCQHMFSPAPSHLLWLFELRTILEGTEASQYKGARLASPASAPPHVLSLPLLPPSAQGRVSIWDKERK